MATFPSNNHRDPAVRQLWAVKELADSTETPEAVRQGIDKALQLVQQREEYCDKLSTPPSEVLHDTMEITLTHPWEEVHKQGETIWNLKPGMISGHLEGQFLKSLISMCQARKVLEIGMFTGYGALAMAEALPADGELVSCDFDPYLEQFAQSCFDRSPHGKKIRIRIGDAKETMHKLAEEGQLFDAIFMDADKSFYPDYYKIIMDDGLLAPKGTIIVDNALFRGLPYTDIDDPNGKGTQVFNELVMNDPRVHQVILPVRDGISIVRRVEDVGGLVASSDSN